MSAKIFSIVLGGTSGNIYLLQTKEGFILIDTGRTTKRKILVKKLKENGCNPANLKLIILTHGDFDHTGNASYLRDKFNAKIAMHPDDVGMVENSDMFWNRSKGGIMIRFLVNTLIGLRKSDRFTPDLIIDEDFSLNEYGLAVEVVSIPGHSKGSIGLITKEGVFFCGDLITNRKKPELNSIMDDPAAAQLSIEKLTNYKIKTIYPGHGQPFSVDSIKSLFEKISEK